MKRNEIEDVLFELKAQLQRTTAIIDHHRLMQGSKYQLQNVPALVQALEEIQARLDHANPPSGAEIAQLIKEIPLEDMLKESQVETKTETGRGWFGGMFGGRRS
ncbi:hypothetical protein HQ487_00485 [Candidatus Uhrbacteria bacterium]|nr:hypothetical protein [Candidatus Uhrbacteria bacterium]